MSQQNGPYNPLEYLVRCTYTNEGIVTHHVLAGLRATDSAWFNECVTRIHEMFQHREIEICAGPFIRPTDRGELSPLIVVDYPYNPTRESYATDALLTPLRAELHPHRNGIVGVEPRLTIEGRQVVCEADITLMCGTISPVGSDKTRPFDTVDASKLEFTRVSRNGYTMLFRMPVERLTTLRALARLYERGVGYLGASPFTLEFSEKMRDQVRDQTEQPRAPLEE